MNRSGSEESYSNVYSDNDSDNEFYTPKETPRDIMPDLESEELAEQRRNKKGHGLKLLTPQKRLNILRISLAQLKAGKILQKRKNETRQLLNSWCRSKKLSKKIYKHLMNTII